MQNVGSGAGGPGWVVKPMRSFTSMDGLMGPSMTMFRMTIVRGFGLRVWGLAVGVAMPGIPVVDSVPMGDVPHRCQMAAQAPPLRLRLLVSSR